MGVPNEGSMLLTDTLYGRLRTIAHQRGDAVAVVADGGSLSYRELLDQVDRCAAGLIATGCGIGATVAVALPNSPDFVIATLATFAIGGVLVPLNPKFKEDELRHYIETSAPRVILHPPSLDALIESLAGASTTRAHSVTALASDAHFEPVTGIDPNAPALYMFSSGSTGKSKRVTRTQANILAEYDALVRTAGMNAEDCILCTVPLYHAHGFGNALLAALLTGGKLILPGTEFNARTAMNLLVSAGVTVYPGVPFMFKMLCDTRFATPPDLSRLRLAFSAGAPLPESVSAKFSQLYGKTVGQLYGSTETGAISLNVHRQHDKPLSVGLPLSGFDIEIREEDGRLLGPGEAGEIWIRTPAATRGYDGLPEMTEECFAAGYFFAGDTGFRDLDGYLYVTGRKKLLINVAGYKVDPLEVEDVLMKHPRVADAVVIGVEHPGYGEKIKAVIVRRPEAEDCTEDELIAYAAEHLAEYKVPRTVEFRAEVPRSPLGKILRKYL